MCERYHSCIVNDGYRSVVFILFVVFVSCVAGGCVHIYSSHLWMWVFFLNNIQLQFQTNITWQQCQTKWKNLLRTYKKFMDNVGKTEAPPIPKPPFFLMRCMDFSKVAMLWFLSTSMTVIPNRYYTFIFGILQKKFFGGLQCIRKLLMQYRFHMR